MDSAINRLRRLVKDGGIGVYDADQLLADIHTLVSQYDEVRGGLAEAALAAARREALEEAARVADERAAQYTTQGVWVQAQLDDLIAAIRALKERE